MHQQVGKHWKSKFKRNKNELIATGMLIRKEDGKTYDRYRHRIMFPIHDRHGRIIGFGGRAIDENKSRNILNSPETTHFSKKPRTLWFASNSSAAKPH